MNLANFCILEGTMVKLVANIVAKMLPINYIKYMKYKYKNIHKLVEY